ncbi:NAD(P)H-binding protein [Amycolatopsis dongchuanensis]|uniref:NAD(P)H-binding protein n=1 Tax=Amycolatopsis dongchuanensis TaxID=1070866 RepID=A0ABP8VG14_9PSEU
MGTFLILGGTGKVGRRVTRVLQRGGHGARPASRSAALRFDWRVPETWATAVQDIDGLFVVGPGSATDWSSLLTSFLDVASAAGVRHAVLLSARGVEFLPDGNVARAEEALRAGPVPWTILRPTHFAQNFTEAMFTPVEGRVVAPVGDGAEPFVDIEDIAVVAAHVLTHGVAAGDTVDLSGPAAITFARAAQILSEVTGRPITFRDEPDDDHIAALRAAGTPEEYIRWRLAMLTGIRRGADAYLSDGVSRLLGRPATGFSTWARREAREALGAGGR